jgi:glycosyltransferase involved in cell wall biosynthesis
MKNSVSVILCSHNPKLAYINQASEALRRQGLRVQEWEFIVIDNASDPPLSTVLDVNWHPRGRIVRENELGLTPARLRGIRESSGELLVFVDDDNILASDFLETALSTCARYPDLGVFGAGTLEPAFEVSPPAELVPHLPRLALRTVSSALWSNNPADSLSIPYGAGLCVTRRIAAAYVEMVDRLGVKSRLDRKGKELYCGGDDLFSWVSVEKGLGFGVFPELRVTHLILAGRLRRDYFLRLIHDHSFSHGIIRHALFGTAQRRVRAIAYVRLVLHAIRNGLFSMRCQWAAVRGEDKASRYIERERLRPKAVSDASVAQN